MRVLHVPYTYFPDACGGTEVYVQALARRLSALGFPSAIAAPADAAREYRHDGLAVYRFPTDQRKRLELAYGTPDEIAAEGFRAIVGKIRPTIVHLHARTSSVSERLIDLAHDTGAHVIFTYHTPTASCARGTMMLYGEEKCDGLIEPMRCTTCALSALGVPRELASSGAGISAALLSLIGDAEFETRPLSLLRIPGLIARGRDIFGRFASKADHLVAVCQWVRDVLERNGLPTHKITLSRQGIDYDASRKPAPRPRKRAGPLRIAYFGRVDRVKGPDLLAHALRKIPEADVQVDVYAICPEPASREFSILERYSRRDPRLRLYPPVAPGDVRETMAEYDLLAVPSRWLETGPLVVLEAFAAGVPILGSDLGGITELVRDGVDGILLRADDPDAWASRIAELSFHSEAIDRLRRNIKPPRTIDDCAKDMAALYTELADPRAWARAGT